MARSILLSICLLLNLAACKPFINDISTDLEDPPSLYEFDSEGNAINKFEYPKDFASVQKESYPEVQTIYSPLQAASSFAAIKQLITTLPRTEVIQAVAAPNFMLQAVFKSKVFGFKDDLVARVRHAENGGSLIDFRSRSRIGKTDFGVNAKRILSLVEYFEQYTNKEVLEIGSSVTAKLISTLQQRLAQAIETDGPAGALSFCSTEAIDVTSSVKTSSARVTAVKRTSVKYRNPKNAPDYLEQAALKHFATHPKSTFFLQEVKKKNEYRYYAPLYVEAKCLACHGSAKTLSPGVASKLNELYPEDSALNYALGDFRGLVRVSIDKKPTN